MHELLMICDFLKQFGEERSFAQVFVARQSTYIDNLSLFLLQKY